MHYLSIRFHFTNLLVKWMKIKIKKPYPMLLRVLISQLEGSEKGISWRKKPEKELLATPFFQRLHLLIPSHPSKHAEVGDASKAKGPTMSWYPPSLHQQLWNRFFFFFWKKKMSLERLETCPSANRRVIVLDPSLDNIC